jgi:ELWxxDGT repeat protein
VNGGNLYFVGGFGSPQAGLWRTDGTAAGTTLVKAMSTPPNNVVASNGSLYLRVGVASSDPTLWVSNGTPEGTVPVSQLAFIGDMTPFAGRVFFFGTDATYGTELWSSDGTPAGTRVVEDVWPGPRTSTNALTLGVTGNVLYYSAETPLTGLEPWRWVPDADAPSWLAAGGNATWDAATKTLTVTGTAAITADPSADRPTINVNGPAALLTINPTPAGPVDLASLNLSNGATAAFTAGGGERTLVVGSLSISTGATLDLADHAIVVRSGGPAAVRALLASTYNAGNWNGTGGIGSSAAANDPNKFTALGYGSNPDLNKTSFDGVTGLTASDVFVKYTYYGDANLDGQVDIGDLGLLAGAWQQSGTDWFHGDFTYNGTVDIGDLGLLSGNWQKGVGNPL